MSDGRCKGKHTNNALAQCSRISKNKQIAYTPLVQALGASMRRGPGAHATPAALRAHRLIATPAVA